jgi:hypothetical protein
MRIAIPLALFASIVGWGAPPDALGMSALTMPRYTVTVGESARYSRPGYTAIADVLTFGSAYRADLAYLGRPSIGFSPQAQFGPAQVQATAPTPSARPSVYPEGIVSLVSAHPHDAIINGGFSAADPGTPAGLLLVDGSVISPLSFQRSIKGEHYQLSAVLCFDRQGKLSLTSTEQVASATASVTKNCTSALQAGPIVVNQGGNVIAPSEMRTSPSRRTIIGWDSSGNLTVALFESPVNLYAAAEFMRAPRGNGQHFVVQPATSRGISQGNTIPVSGSGDGLGLVQAINLDGDQDSIAVLGGKVLTGDVYRKIPSAIVIKASATSQ